MALEFEKELTAASTNIPGMLVLDLPVHGDSRGWFKENWQREKMRALGLPDMGPVQNNISFNDEAGVTRGIHAEPWDKFISVACGRVFGAWVDLRPSATASPSTAGTSGASPPASSSTGTSPTRGGMHGARIREGTDRPVHEHPRDARVRPARAR